MDGGKGFVQAHQTFASALVFFNKPALSFSTPTLPPSLVAVVANLDAAYKLAKSHIVDCEL